LFYHRWQILDGIMPLKVMKVLAVICWISVLCYADTSSKTATKIVLGGEWFTETTTGEKGGYLMSDFKDKVFEPIIK
jgi:hypothetical protein